ncbi:MAG: hypothetical protein JNN15_06140 [Blastocatellia bacterium]|nr:hypothetical protein [Blastocatellia bacterium]
MSQHLEEILELSRKLHELGYRRQWKVGDEICFDRKLYPTRYRVQHLIKSSPYSVIPQFLLIRRRAKFLRVGVEDERLIHIPQAEDVVVWFRKQPWIDFHVLRRGQDANWEFTFYYHKKSTFKNFHQNDARLVSLQAMVAAHELIASIIAE